MGIPRRFPHPEVYARSSGDQRKPSSGRRHISTIGEGLVTLLSPQPLSFDTPIPDRTNYPRSVQLRLHENIRPSRARDISENQLLFTKLETEAIGDVVDLFKSQGRRSAAICADGAGADFAEPLIAEFARHGLPVPAITDCSDVAEAARGRDGVFCAVGDAPKLSRTLTRLRSLCSAFVWAPKTSHYFKSRPVFVQSVPKSGTHIVFECLKAFGYAEPPSLDLPDFDAVLADGVFYNLQHMPISVLVFPLSEVSPFHRRAIALRCGFHRPRSA